MKIAAKSYSGVTKEAGLMHRQWKVASFALRIPKAHPQSQLSPPKGTHLQGQNFAGFGRFLWHWVAHLLRNPRDTYSQSLPFNYSVEAHFSQILYRWEVLTLTMRQDCLRDHLICALLTRTMKLRYCFQIVCSRHQSRYCSPYLYTFGYIGMTSIEMVYAVVSASMSTSLLLSANSGELKSLAKVPYGVYSNPKILQLEHWLRSG